jgi:hypothetical protein
VLNKNSVDSAEYFFLHELLEKQQLFAVFFDSLAVVLKVIKSYLG